MLHYCHQITFHQIIIFYPRKLNTVDDLWLTFSLAFRFVFLPSFCSCWFDLHYQIWRSCDTHKSSETTAMFVRALKLEPNLYICWPILAYHRYIGSDCYRCVLLDIRTNMKTALCFTEHIAWKDAIYKDWSLFCQYTKLILSQMFDNHIWLV